MKSDPQVTMKMYPGDRLDLRFSCSPDIIRVFYPEGKPPYALVYSQGSTDPQRIDFARAEDVARFLAEREAVR